MEQKVRKRTLRYGYRVRKIDGHKCELDVKENIINLQVRSGWCVKLRRYIWKLTTINANHPDSKRYFLSTAQINEEESRHIVHHYYMVYPFSTFVLYWNCIMILVRFLSFIVIPMAIGVITGNVKSRSRVLLKLVLDIFSTVDIILNFVTGFYCKSRNKVILDSKQVAKHYISSYFCPDVISAFPYQVVLFYSYQPHLFHLKLLMLFKLVRVPTFLRYIRRFCERNPILKELFPYIAIVLTFLISIHFSTGMTYYYKNTFQQSIDETYFYNNIISSFLSINLVYTKRFFLVQTHDPGERPDATIYKAWEILCLMFGAAFHAILIARLMQIYHKQSSSKMKYDNLVEEISEYMKYKELPPTVKDKVLKYVEYKFRKRIFREEDIMLTLSPNFKEEILQQSCERMVKKVPFFKDLPQKAMLRIVNKLKAEIYLPNDIIVCAGYSGHTMYFIYTGTVAVYTKNGTEICHLNDGVHFGEVALLTNAPRVATVIAVKECELFKLTRRDFQEAIEPFPDLVKQMQDSAHARIENTMQIMQEHSDSIDDKSFLDSDDEFLNFLFKVPEFLE